jgi:hypothetical protein
MRRFVTDATKQAFAEAIREIEAASAVEVVVAVRGRSGSYLQATWVAAASAAPPTSPAASSTGC